MSTTASQAQQRQTDGRSTRWDTHKAARSDVILDAAIEVLSDVGPDAGVKDIADRAGLPRSVVYRIFADRADLDDQVRERIIERLLDDLAPTLIPSGSIRQAIVRSVETYVSWIVTNPNLHTFVNVGSRHTRQASPHMLVEARTAIALQLTALFRAVMEGRSAQSRLAEPLAFGLVGLVDSAVNRWLANPSDDLNAQQLIDFLAASIWQLLDYNMRLAGVILDPTMRFGELA